jgi:glycosyltransferase 2 family protein
VTGEIARGHRRARLLLSSLVGTALGLLLLWLVFRKADVTALLGAIRASDPRLVLAALCASLLAVVAKAVRWVVLTRRAARLPLRASVEAVFVGSAGNALLSHLGEIPRIAMASRATGAGIPALLTSIVAERVFDLVALAVMMAALLVLGGDHGGPSASMERVLAVAGVGACLAVVAALGLGSELASRLERPELAARAPWRARIASRLRQVLQALEVFRDGPSLVGALLLSLVMWTLFALCILCCLLATGVGASFGDALIVLGVNAVALILPAPPGRVGTIEASFAVGMSGGLASEPTVLAASILYNMLMTVPLWCIGGAIWWRYTRRRAGGFT